MSTPRGWLFPLPKRWFDPSVRQKGMDPDDMPDLSLFKFDETGEIVGGDFFSHGCESDDWTPEVNSEAEMHRERQNDVDLYWNLDLSTVQVDRTLQPDELFSDNLLDPVLPSDGMHSGDDWINEPMTTVEPPTRTIYQASKNLNLEAGSMESNIDFTFLGPGRSRGRKKNGQKRA